MKPRTQEEIEAIARQAAERDLAALLESGLPITPELVQAMARRSAEAQAAGDLAEFDEEPVFEVEASDASPAPERGSWLGKLFHW